MSPIHVARRSRIISIAMVGALFFVMEWFA